MNKIGICVCSVCGEEKDNSNYQFYKTRIDKHGYRIRVNTNCKDCCKRLKKDLNKLKKKYKRPELNTPCKCCGKDITRNNLFNLDHNHDKGTFRGWICKACNTGIGKLGDTYDSVLKVLKYLKKCEEKEGRVFKKVVKKIKVIKRFYKVVSGEKKLIKTETYFK